MSQRLVFDWHPAEGAHKRAWPTRDTVLCAYPNGRWLVIRRWRAERYGGLAAGACTFAAQLAAETRLQVLLAREALQAPEEAKL